MGGDSGWEGGAEGLRGVWGLIEGEWGGIWGLMGRRWPRRPPPDSPLRGSDCAPRFCLRLRMWNWKRKRCGNGTDVSWPTRAL